MATAEVMSMLLVAERLEPKQPQALKGSPTTGSRSQYPDLVEGPRNQEASGSQLPERRTPNQVPASAGALGSQGPRSFQVLDPEAHFRSQQPAHHQVPALGGALRSWGPGAPGSRANGDRSTRPPWEGPSHTMISLLYQ
jgi:hypothetical protein